MDWWILELIKVVALIILAVALHQVIRGFGKRFVADLFRSTPQVGRSFIVLADISYYLIFVAYTLFNVHFEQSEDWAAKVGAHQLEDTVFSFAGICLIIGILHGMNVFVLPFIGSILSFRERFTAAAQKA